MPPGQIAPSSEQQRKPSYHPCHAPLRGRAAPGPPVLLARMPRWRSACTGPQTPHLANGQPSLEEPGRGDTELSHPPHPSSLPPYSCDSSAHSLVQPSGAVPTPPPSPGSQAALHHPTRPTFLRIGCTMGTGATESCSQKGQGPSYTFLSLLRPLGPSCLLSQPEGHQEAQSTVGFSPKEWMVTQSPLCPYPRPPTSC